MSQETWSAVDAYIADQHMPRDAALEEALAASTAAGLPEIQVSPAFGKMLHLHVRMLGARRVLELGTLGGYSTIWLARALPPGGKVFTLESEPAHADVARRNIERAGFGGVVEVRVGAALELLPELQREGAAPFDFIFIDADKDNYPAYLPWALRLSRRGTVIVADNVIRNGEVTDPDHGDVRVQGVRRFLELLASEPRVSATVIQTVGSKGYDGFALAVVLDG